MNMKNAKDEKKLQFKSQIKLCKCFYMILHLILINRK